MDILVGWCGRAALLVVATVQGAACLPDEDCADTATCPRVNADDAAADVGATLADASSRADVSAGDAFRGDVASELALREAEFADTAIAADARPLDGGVNSIESTNDAGPVPCATGATRKCGDDPEVHALGNCVNGIETCTAGVWGPCSVKPQAKDACTEGDDANCNGKMNDGCPCVDGAKQSCGPAAQIGECRRGTQTCAGSNWGECVGAVTAKPRDCTSGLDVDCDGTPDNEVDAVCKCAAGGIQECDVHIGKDGKGRCQAGSQTCIVSADKRSSAFGACAGAVGPAAADACDVGNDANCNGIPNEGCPCVNGTTQACGPAAMVGVCKPGVQTCAASAWGPCAGAVFASGRDCTKATDGDCNGTPDQSEASCDCSAGSTRDCTTTRLGPCKPGTQSCVLASDKKSTSWSTCTGIAPAAKDACDPGQDNNCNGIVNEGCACVNGATKACGSALGACVQGTQTCVSSAWGPCIGAVTARSRDCTRTGDNDCNGTEDRLEAPCTVCPLGGAPQSCSTGLMGPCAAGTRACVASADKQSVSWGTCTGRTPAAVDGCNPPDDANCNGQSGQGCCDPARLCGTTCCGALPPNSAFCPSPGVCSACKGATLTCGNASTCGAWDFESGVGPWEVWTGFALSGSTTSVTAPAGGVGKSLAVTYVDPIGANGEILGIRYPLCSGTPGTTPNARGKTVTVRVRFENRAGSSFAFPAGVGLYLDAYTTDMSQIVGVASGNLQVGFWYNLSLTLPTASFASSAAYMSIGVGILHAPWEGTIYIDDLIVE